MDNKLFFGPNAKPAPSDHTLHEMLKLRWSPRAFSSQPIPPKTLATLFEAARWAPSASNEQPWAFVYAHHADTAAFARILDTINPGNQAWAKDAGVLLITATRRNRIGKEDVNVTAEYDLGQAVAGLSVQATALGIAVHQMGGFQPAKAQEMLGIPATHRVLTAIALGYPGDPAALPENFREREAAPRVRNAVSSFVFQGQWGAPD